MYGVLFVSLYFEVFLLITFFEHLSAPKPARSKRNLPTAAVIVPCFNEEKTVGATLNSLLNLRYPIEKLHIIAVDDGSTDNTLEVLKSFEHHLHITILTKENGGKHTALNTACEYTDADIIGCLDADSYVDQDALLYIASHFKDPAVSAVTPGIKVDNAKSIIQLMQKAEYGLAIFVRNVFALMDAQFVTPGPFSFFRREVILSVGKWNYGHSTEDLEMCLRLQKEHHKITNESRALVTTTAPKTFRALYKQRVRWTYGFLRNALDYSHLFFNPKYGALGLLVLPLSLISIFGATFLFGSLIWNTFVRITEEIIKFQTVGISTPTVQFDIFYVQTSTLFTIVLALIILTLVIIGIGKKLSNEKIFSFDIPVYLTLYGFLTPIWLTVSIYKAAANSGVRWR